MPKSIRVADFNQDQNLDIAVVNAGGIDQNKVTVLLGQGGMTFSNAISTATGGLGSIAMAVGEFKHDRKIDVAVANNGSNNVSILLGNGDGTFRLDKTYAVGRGPVAIATADFNRDGNMDLAVLNSSSGDLTILLGKRNGGFRPGDGIFLGGAPTAVKIADFNRDGIPDLTFQMAPSV